MTRGTQRYHAVMQPLRLTPDLLVHDRSAPPLATQLADHLRQLIASHDLLPGQELPGELQIAADTGLSRTSARNALVTLVNEGLLERAAGAATRVVTPPPVRRMDVARFDRQLKKLAEGHDFETSFVVGHGATWDQYSVNPIEVTKEKATAQDSLYLGVAKGTSNILRRRMVECIDGQPLQIRRSALPFKLAGHTLLADATTYPWHGGTLAELHAIGVTPTRFTQESSARMPNRTEREFLRLKTTGPVWDIVRVFLRGDDPVEVSRTIAPCSRNTLYDEGQLSPDPS